MCVISGVSLMVLQSENVTYSKGMSLWHKREFKITII